MVKLAPVSSGRYNAMTIKYSMKIKIYLCSLILLIYFFSCSNPVSPDENDRFAIYLLQNDSLTTKDAQEMKLSHLVLKDKPVFSFSDIAGYQIEDHKVYLKKSPSTYFGTVYIPLFSEYFGKPFVLIGLGQRIYLGSFHSLASSWRPITPCIFGFLVINDENSFIIHRAAIHDDSTFCDVRNDKRILQALSDKIID